MLRACWQNSEVIKCSVLNYLSFTAQYLLCVQLDLWSAYTARLQCIITFYKCGSSCICCFSKQQIVRKHLKMLTNLKIDRNCLRSFLISQSNKYLFTTKFTFWEQALIFIQIAFMKKYLRWFYGVFFRQSMQ